VRLVVVSNRLPVVIARGTGGSLRVEPGAGGLVTALRPVLRNRGGTWIGWPGIEGGGEENLDALLDEAPPDGYRFRTVLLTHEEKEGFYDGFSNEVIWPLFHDTSSRCNFDPRYWETYVAVNRKFAQATARHSADEDFVWVHDYHLMGMAAHYRQIRPGCRIAFFLHIPFPAPDTFLKLPWRFQILEMLLAYDLIGFQTLRDRRNFIQCLRTLITGAQVAGKGMVVTALAGSRCARLGAFPIGIDFQEFSRAAAQADVSEEALRLRADESGRQILLGVDRLDYSKGIPQKLEAFGRALESFPPLRGRVTLVQVVVPSREGIPDYAQQKSRIERLVGEINGRFTRSGWVPIHYLFRALERPTLLAYYRVADAALVLPLKDGMNLVAKEYCAANVTEEGALILSEFAGAAAQMQGSAFLANPFDVEGVARTIHQALSLDPGDRRERMRRLRRGVKEFDIFWWLNSCLRAAFSRDLGHFPVLEDYVPQPEGDHVLLAH
jgi:trehalose 6-phosphate synthase